MPEFVSLVLNFCEREISNFTKEQLTWLKPYMRKNVVERSLIVLRWLCQTVNAKTNFRLKAEKAGS